MISSGRDPKAGCMAAWSRRAFGMSWRSVADSTTGLSDDEEKSNVASDRARRWEKANGE